MLTNTPIQILLVEDDEVDRSIVRRALSNSGLAFEMQEVFDGADAVEAVASRHFDCIILDYNLPDQDGSDVFESITRNQDTTAAVIFLTGEDSEELALSVMESGAVDFLNKNDLTPAILQRAIRFARARQSFLSELTRIGRRDSLTGLPNRSVLEDTLTNALAQCRRSKTVVAALLLDLDHFKDVNDTMGHPAGDELLQAIAKQLKFSTRESDTVSRLGGDEFIILAPNMEDEQGAQQLAEKILDAMSQPILIGEDQVHISTSIGIAIAPNDGTSSAKILKSADLALYKAKGGGRARCCFYDESMDIKAHYRGQMERDLRQALQRQEFELYYQPKVNAKTGAMIGVEALLRWNHPERGLVAPDEFVPLAEATRLIIPIGEWVLRTASAQVMAWEKQGLHVTNCSVNLSAVQLSDSPLLEVFDSVLSETGINPSCLEFEITEGALMKGIDTIAACLQAMRDKGSSITVDDFGTGYSSLVHLKQLPLDKLKIDRSFISNMLTSMNDAEITNMIVSLGRSIGLEVIAEGAETEAEVDMLQNFGCDQIQGYFYSRPLPADQLFAWHQRHNLVPRDVHSRPVEDGHGNLAPQGQVSEAQHLHLYPAP